jgi:hypothetical protein
VIHAFADFAEAVLGISRMVYRIVRRGRVAGLRWPPWGGHLKRDERATMRVDWLRLTFNLSEPINQTIVDSTSQASDVVDLQPSAFGRG